MTLESGITFFIAIFIFSVTPGPGCFTILARSMVEGVKSSICLALGMVMGDICYLIMACLGLAALAQTWESVFLLVRIVGTIYLLYLGWKMWTSDVNLSKELEEAGQEDQIVTKKKVMSFTDVIQGFMISSSNPKVILFYIAFLPTFMDVTSLSTKDIAITSILAFCGLTLGLMLVALIGSQARRYLVSPRSMKVVNRTAGSIMAGAGVYIGLRG